MTARPGVASIAKLRATTISQRAVGHRCAARARASRLTPVGCWSRLRLENYVAGRKHRVHHDWVHPGAENLNWWPTP